MSGKLVTISEERLKQLEELEAKMPAMSKIVNKYNEKLDKLHKKTQENITEHNKRVLDNYHAKKEEINARRRAAYKAKKEAAKGAAAGGVNPE